MTAGSGRRAIALAMAGAAPILLVLGFSLPANTFVAGDSGVKLIAARNALAHPSRPFDIDLPTIAGRPVPYVERFFAIHNDHAHALQSPMFPVISAPFIAAFGLRGAYFLPLAAFLALLPALDAIRRRVDPAIPIGIVLAIAVLTNPVFFYALEFWEHVPAVAAVAAATALVLARHDAVFASVAAGALAAFAVLLRPEAVWYVSALTCLVRPWHRVGIFVTGAAAVFAPFALYNYVEYGAFAGPHAAANLAPLTQGWIESRRQYLVEWLALTSPMVLVGIAVAVGGWLARRAGTSLDRTQLFALLPVTALAVAGSLGMFLRESLWHAWPIAFLLFVPTDRHSRALWLLLLASTIGIVVSAPHHGGSQWGPRFLLIATPALIVLVAGVAADVMKPGYGSRARMAMLVVVMLAGLWTTRAAYRELRGSKQTYQEIVSAFASFAPPGSYVVTSIWSLDQITASLYPTRRFLFAADVPTGTAILRELEAAGTARLVLVWPEADAEAGDSLAPILTSGCYRAVNVQRLPIVGWTATIAVCGGGKLQ